jgi:hypothetical protein
LQPPIEFVEALEESGIVGERLRLIVHVSRQLYLQLSAIRSSSTVVEWLETAHRVPG